MCFASHQRASVINKYYLRFRKLSNDQLLEIFEQITWEVHSQMNDSETFARLYLSRYHFPLGSGFQIL